MAVFWNVMLHRLVKSTDVQRILRPSLSVLILEVVGSLKHQYTFSRLYDITIQKTGIVYTLFGSSVRIQ